MLARKLRNEATPAERKLWGFLSRRQRLGFKFSRQMPVGPFVCDFMWRSAKLVIEVDGGQHDWMAEADRQRTAYIESQGYRVIRFWNNDVIDRIEGVVGEIERVLMAMPTPAPSRSAGGEDSSCH